MLLFLLAYLGGGLTIVSPCILPVLPFVFSRAGQSFLRSGLPMLVGMAVSFAVVASLAAVLGGWGVAASQYGRLAAMMLLAGFGVALLFPRLSVRLSAPVVSLGGFLSRRAEKGKGIWGAALLGIATGLVWAPCAGPVLGLILTGAALNGPNVKTLLLLFAYAAGAATSLALALLAGGRIFARMKRSLGFGEWAQRGAGALALAAVGVIALGVDTGFLTDLSLANASALEERLLGALNPVIAETQAGSAMMSANPAMMMAFQTAPEANAALPVEGVAPTIEGATEWLNSAPLTNESLKGKVVLIDFWTYSCINCVRAIPYVRAWAEKYKDQGLLVIGVHSPEFAFERDGNNVKQAIARQQIAYPVAVDNAYSIWRAFKNHYWPAHYFIDAQGRIRHHHFGEGGYDRSERVIQQLLAEAGQSSVASDVVSVNASGAEAASNLREVRSPETYLGFQRAGNFISDGGFVLKAAKDYKTGDPRLNEWGLTGKWIVGEEQASLDGAQGSIVFRFHARDLHLVLGPGPVGKPIRFQVTIGGAPPGAAHGIDVNAEGDGVVTEQRLYQLIRQPGEIGDRRFEIRFLDPGVEAYVFTFG